MTKREVTQERPSVFSSLHRDRTHERFYMTDTDWILYDYARVGYYHPDTFVGNSINGEIIFHASLDEKLTNIDIENGDELLLKVLGESSVILQSAMPWPSFCMFIDQKKNLFFLVTLNEKSKCLLRFIQETIQGKQFAFINDYFDNGLYDICAFQEPEMNTLRTCETWNIFEFTLRKYIKRS